LKFIFGVINAPPVYYTEDQLEKLYSIAVFPFLNELYKYREIKITMFFSGPFLEWIDRKHPEYIAVLQEMIKRKQVEILGGGYFMPVLPMISHPDRLGQIELLTTSIRKILGKRPRGVWLTKGLWDTSLAQSLKTAGMEFTFLADGFFKALRVKNREWCFPKITEYQGKAVTVFPYTHYLSAKALERDWESVEGYFQNKTKKNNAFISLFLPVEGCLLQDEKNKNFFTNGGLKTILKIIRDYWATLDSVHPGSFLRKNQDSLGKVYFGSISFDDLEAVGYQEDTSDLPRGRQNMNFRQYLTLHKRSNLLYSKMVHAQSITYQVRGDRYRKKSALEELWRAQSRDTFTQWKDGGWKNYEGRTSAYSSLIAAEKIARSTDVNELLVTPSDFDMDGVQEYLSHGKNNYIYLDTKGGQIIEWDWVPQPWNFLNAYIPDREDAGGWNPGAFVDWLGLEIPQNLSGTYLDLAQNEQAFGQYRVEDVDRDQGKVVLSSTADVFTQQGRKSLRIRKVFRFTPRGIKLSLTIDTPSGTPIVFTYGLENDWVFRYPASKSPLIYTNNQANSHTLDAPVSLEGNTVTWIDASLGVQSNIAFSRQAKIESFPVFLGEGKQNYQCHVILPLWEVHLEDKPWTLDVEWHVISKNYKK
jgi:hypothetical protein